MKPELLDELSVWNEIYRITNSNHKAIEALSKFAEKYVPEELSKEFVERIGQIYYLNKYIGRSKSIISMNAIKLAIKIKESLDWLVFPQITKVASRGFDTSGGTWSWSMQRLGPPGDCVGSLEPVRYCLHSKAKLYDQENCGEITAEKEHPY